MSGADLSSLFEQLDAPGVGEGGSERFKAQPLTKFSFARLAKDSRGRPVILLGLRKDPNFSAFDYAFSNFSIHFALRCSISEGPGSGAEETLCAIRCRSDEGAIRRCFLDVMGTFLESLPDPCSEQRLSNDASLLVELFEPSSVPSTETVQGLWGELFLIRGAADPLLAMKAWHASPQAKVDFAAGAELVEVKSTLKDSREHQFSFEQANPPVGCRALIASMLLEEDPTGASVLDLCAEIESLMQDSPDMRLKLQRIARRTLGAGWENAGQKRFSLARAEDRLRFFDTEVIPRIGGEIPPRVSDVHFCSSLEGTEPVNCAELPAGGLFAALANRQRNVRS